MTRIECRIHGGYWHMPLVSIDTENHTATVAIGSYHSAPVTERVLPMVPRDRLRFHENAANEQDCMAASNR